MKISELTKASMMRFCTLIATLAAVICLLTQPAIQIITAIKGNAIYTPEWWQLGLMIILILTGKAVQKFAEK